MARVQYIPHLHRALADPAQIGYVPYVAGELTLEQACSAGLAVTWPLSLANMDGWRR